MAFFDSCLALMKDENIKFIKISDYNTKGVAGSDVDDNENDWYKLVKSSGDSNKDTQAGGSFGLGKNAYFACSGINTVFIATKDFQGKTAFQGISHLGTHPSIMNGKKTQGTGYYGAVDFENFTTDPVTDFDILHPFFKRDAVGTDIIIPCFIGDEEGETKIIKSLLEYFFVAIMNNQLVAVVGSKKIDHENLEQILKKYAAEDKKFITYNYYQAMVSSEKRYFTIHDLNGKFDEIELYVLPDNTFHRQIAMVRNNGMKIRDRGYFPAGMKFAGVLITKGEKINGYLRKLEPPSHNNWAPERHPDKPKGPKEAKRVLNELYGWATEMVRSIFISEDSDVSDFEEMSKYFPDDMDEAPFPGSDAPEEGPSTVPKDPEVNKNKPKEPSTKIKVERVPDLSSGPGPAPGPAPGPNPGPRPGPAPGPKPGPAPGPDPGPGPRKFVKLSIARRAYCLDPDNGSYHLSIKSPVTKPIYLSVSIKGEVEKEIIRVKEAEDTVSHQKLPVENNIIGPLDIIADQKYDINVTFGELMRCALEVAASYEE
jgi:hypothetical protein